MATTDMPTVTVELTYREVRALVNVAGFFEAAIREEAEDWTPEPDDPAVLPLVSGAMKLEMALIQERAEI